jgi:hypothetical protein
MQSLTSSIYVYFFAILYNVITNKSPNTLYLLSHVYFLVNEIEYIAMFCFHGNIRNRNSL